MAAILGKNHKLKRTDSKKSHSWWWDSHVSPKNNKWLQENLEEMDHNVKRMLKLIEEDADSFAKRAEMYYKKRPELVHLVEEFYRMYRALAERYDHVTGELRKNLPTDLQSQGSGISDASSEPPSFCPSPDQRFSRRKSGPRAAGFEFFLGIGESTREGDESSTLDSESESDASSVNNYIAMQNSDEEQGLRKRIVELEVELHDVKEKFRMLQEDISEGSSRGTKIGDSEVLMTKIALYEEELKVAREKINLSEEEINKLRDELQKYKSTELCSNAYDEIDIIGELSEPAEAISEMQKENAAEQNGDSGTVMDQDQESKIRVLAEQLKFTKQKLLESEKEVVRLRLELQGNESSIHRLQEQLVTSQKDVSFWKAKVEKEKREGSKLQDRLVRYKSNLSERDQEIRGLRETVSNANKSLSEENAQLQAEITQLLKEKMYLEDNVKEMDLRCQSLEEDVKRIKAGKAEMEVLLEAEIENLKAAIDEKNNHIDELNKYLDELKLKYDALLSEKDTLDVKFATCITEMSVKDIEIREMNQHLQQLHMEHVELIAGAEGARKRVEELRSRVGELEKEVERQKEEILEGAEEKREAIRQLCFSLDHYRNGYNRLLQAFGGNKQRLPVMAS